MMNGLKMFMMVLLLTGLLTGCGGGGDTSGSEAPLTENVDDNTDDTPVDDSTENGDIATPALSYGAAVSAGYDYSLALDSVGNVFSFGIGTSGQLGHGDTDDRDLPERITTASNIVAISASPASSISVHTLLLDKYGDVYSFGDHHAGQLGHGYDENGFSPIDSDIPKKIETLSDIVAIETGYESSFVIDIQGDVYSFGRDTHGDLGHGVDIGDIATPMQIEALADIVAISSNYSHTLALDKHGDVYSFGDGSMGKLGHGDLSDRTTPKKIEALSNIIAIAAGDGHSLALNSSGQVYSFGTGDAGQLGHGDGQDYNMPKKIEALSDIVAIAAGDDASFAIDKSGDAYGFGSNTYSKIGSEDNYGNIYGPTKIDSLSNIVQVAPGNYHTLALDKNGYVYSFGNNFFGQLGQGDDDDYDTPTRIDALSL